MIKLNVKIGVLSTVVSVLLLSTYIKVISPVLTEIEKSHELTGISHGVNAGEINGEISESSLSNIIDDVRSSKGRYILTITSPGGLVTEGAKLQKALKNRSEVVTYVPVEAASMGATLLMSGDKRFADESAMILFHSAHAGNYSTSYVNALKMKKILNSEVFKNYFSRVVSGIGLGSVMVNGNERGSFISPEELLSDETYVELPTDDINTNKVVDNINPLDIAIYNKLAMMVKEIGFDTVQMMIDSLVDSLRVINDGLVMTILNTLKKSDESWTKERVESEIFLNFEKDAIFSGRQLFDMGVITGLGQPDEEKLNQKSGKTQVN